MGLCGSKQPDQNDGSAAQSKDVERQLLEERIQALYNFKILLLGAGESGKSTILKQLQFIHQNKKLTSAELESIAESLHANSIECMRVLLDAARDRFQLSLDDEEDRKTAEALQDFPQGQRISPELAESMTRLWKSQAITQTYARRAEFWILDACPYYMSNLDRFAQPGFVPTEEDVMFSRIRTTGVVSTHMDQKLPDPQPGEPSSLRFEVVDVGGQRNERRKWINVFSNVNAILFIESLAGYHQVLFEDNSKLRMHESLDLFHSITNRPDFKDTPIFLILNKKDLFEQMIKEHDLRGAFPDYTGGQEVMPALEFVKQKFFEKAPAGKKVESFVVTSVVKREIKYAFEDIMKELIDNNRRKLQHELKDLDRMAQKLK